MSSLRQELTASHSADMAEVWKHKMIKYYVLLYYVLLYYVFFSRLSQNQVH